MIAAKASAGAALEDSRSRKVYSGTAHLSSSGGTHALMTADGPPALLFHEAGSQVGPVAKLALCFVCKGSAGEGLPEGLR